MNGFSLWGSQSQDGLPVDESGAWGGRKRRILSDALAAIAGRPNDGGFRPQDIGGTPPFVGDSIPMGRTTPEEIEGPDQPTRIQEMEGQRRAMDMPRQMTTKQKILRAITLAAPAAIGGIFGGEAGASGAAQGTSEEIESEEARRQLRRRELMAEMEAERNRQERMAERQLTAGVSLAGQIAADRRAEKSNETRLKAAGMSKPKEQMTLLGEDGKPHIMERNPETGAYDIDRGIAYEKPVPGRDVPLSEEVARQQKELRTPAPLAGRDVPYPPAVEAQRMRLRPSPASSSDVEIKQSSPEFRVAQDLAYGKLTFQGFRTLAAYNRDSGKKMAIYGLAAKLNPNFNPAAFEMGFNLAKNQRVQQQLASLDNVALGVPDLIKVSDQATRSGITALNKIIIPGGIMMGGKKYSNFKTAQIAFADELSGALGYGSATDMSREMGFNMTNENLSPANFSSAIREIIMPFVERKRSTLLNQMGVYGQPDMQPGPLSGKQTNGPAVGSVEGGYRFKGGDPANKNNWEKVK